MPELSLLRLAAKSTTELVLKFNLAVPAPKKTSFASSWPGAAGAAPGVAPMLMVPVAVAALASDTVPEPKTCTRP
ncbi:hypothetical protein D3C71_1650600 [compost metagenome]